MVDERTHEGHICLLARRWHPCEPQGPVILQAVPAGPPQPHTRAHSTWVADPNGPPSGRAVGGGRAPDLRRPSQRWKAPSLGTPFRHP